MKNMTLYVGCGGMAIRTLVRLREKLAGGPLDRDRCVAFFAVDSDCSALAHFERGIHGFSNGRPPICKTLQLPGGVSGDREIVESAWTDRLDKDALSKLAQHWWFAPSDETDPISSSGHSNGETRALGTETMFNWSAATAYLATWHSLPRLDSLVRDMVREGSSSSVEGFERRWIVWVVVGMAGATGRGCWALTAMKIRQCLQELGIDVRLRGVFLDASYCGELFTSMPDDADRLRLNSLLAFSELSAWLKVGWRLIKYDCRLPSLLHPEVENGPGAISASESDDWWLRAPVSEAFVVSGEGVGAAASCQDYAEMVATALYARMIDLNLGACEVNWPVLSKGLFAASFVVDTPSLQSFADHMARLAYVERLCESDEWEAGNKRISRLRSCWHIALNRIRQGVTQGSDGCLSAFEEQSHVMLTRRGADVTAIGNVLRHSLAEPDGNAAFVSSAEKSVLADAGLEGEDVSRSVTRLIWQACAPDGEVPSFERVRAYAHKVESALGQAIAEISVASGVPVPALSQTAIADAFVNGPYQAVQRGGGILSRLTRRTFSRNAVDGLRARYVDYLQASLAVAVRSSVMPKLERMRDELRRTCTALDGLLLVLKHVLQGMEKQDERFKGYLANPDDWVNLETLPGVLSEGPFRRLLTPIVSREEVNRLLSIVQEEQRSDVSSMQAFGQRAMELFLQGDGDGIEGIAREFTGLVEVLVRPVNLNEIGFSFMSMLRRNVKIWNGLLEASAGDVRIHERLKSLLRCCLGIKESDFASDARGLPHLDVETVLKGIVVSTCSICRRMSDSGKGVEDMGTVGAVLVPTNLDDGLRMRIEKGLHDERLRDFSIDDIEGNGHLIESPDGVIACLSVGSCNLKGSLSDAVPSLNCWRSPKLLPLLRMAEDPDGAAYFEKSAVSGRYVERRYAVGYVSPIFVRHPEMSKGRWRPWWTQNLGENRVRGSRRAEPRPYDVFISYRRDGGVDPARMLALKLEGPAYGYKVFFDQDSIRQGVFNQAIFKAIEECRYFVLVVTEGAFDRCAEENDWVRQEVERALKAGKTIIPVAPYPEKSCAFPRALPSSMSSLADLQIAELNMRQLFDVSVRQMVGARFV